jgi:hypothetical protein
VLLGKVTDIHSKRLLPTLMLLAWFYLCFIAAWLITTFVFSENFHHSPEHDSVMSFSWCVMDLNWEESWPNTCAFRREVVVVRVICLWLLVLQAAKNDHIHFSFNNVIMLGTSVEGPCLH